jgi:arylsulfatase A-like enzyme
MGYFVHSINDNGVVHGYGARTSDYQTDVYARTALAALRRQGRSRKPFFMWLSFWAPHEGGPRDADDPPDILTPSPAPRHRDRFAVAPLPRWPSLNERDVSDKPYAIRRLPLLSPWRLAEVRESYQQRLESLLAVDEAVGRIVAELRRQKILKRTLILFTSDNGFLEGQHRVMAGKQFFYEPSVRVPLVLRGPGVPRGLHLKQETANVDLAPTISSAARATADLPMDGRALQPLLRDRTLEWGRDILVERGPGERPFGPRLYTGIRTPRYVLVDHSTGEHELYDLTADPDELVNHYGDPAYATVETELAERLVRLRECVGAFCRVGPQLSLSLAYEGACYASPLLARVEGGDEQHTSYVEFISGGRRFRDAKPPFERVLPPESTPTIRALAVLVDGRRLTLGRTLRACR